ncbi:MAG TPA: hypothetical protein ENJ27_02310 [Candidatus Moranbacteria bacterium]|nr:hypothetical protein [Candidatus Moranbacteria bacterium]
MEIIKKTKTKIKNELTKKRSIKNKKVKKALFVIFLLFVDCYVIFNITNQLKANWTVHIVAVNADDKVAILRSDDKSQAGVSASLNVKGGDNTPPSIEDKIKKAFPDNWETMLAIAKAESRLIPTAEHTNKNGTKDIGLFQINSIHGYDSNKLKDVDFNINVAREIYDRQGIAAWSAWNNKSYLQFME